MLFSCVRGRHWLLHLLCVHSRSSRSCALVAPAHPSSLAWGRRYTRQPILCSLLGWSDKGKLIDTWWDWIWNVGLFRILVHILFLAVHSPEPNPEGLAIINNRFSLHCVQEGSCYQRAGGIQGVGKLPSESLEFKVDVWWGDQKLDSKHMKLNTILYGINDTPKK